MNNAGGVTPTMQDCLASEFVHQDKRLNLAYQKLLTRLSKPKAVELRKVQRIWISYVEAKCGFLYDGEDFNGTADRLEANYCSVNERAQLAEELELLAR
jgi:uncharacterized protein YecT (DUF1311 family)